MNIVPNAIQTGKRSLDDIKQGISVHGSKSGSSMSLDKNPADHLGSLDMAIAKQNPRRNSVRCQRLHNPNEAVEVPLGDSSAKGILQFKKHRGILGFFQNCTPKSRQSGQVDSLVHRCIRHYGRFRSTFRRTEEIVSTSRN